MESNARVRFLSIAIPLQHPRERAAGQSWVHDPGSGQQIWLSQTDNCWVFPFLNQC